MTIVANTTERSEVVFSNEPTMNNKIYISLGTNIGNRQQNLETALHEIAAFSTITKKSSIYETEPVGYKPQPDFLNMVIEIDSELTPSELIIKLCEIEHKMGRVKEIQNGPRIIDLDILLYNDSVINHPDLIVPHPRLVERQFILRPLLEIAPNIIHPILNQDIETLSKILPTTSKVTLWT